METVTLKIQDHAVQRVMHLLKNLPKSDVEVVLASQASKIHSNKQSMAGCLAQYAKPELIEKEKQLFDDAQKQQKLALYAEIDALETPQVVRKMDATEWIRADRDSRGSLNI